NNPTGSYVKPKELEVLNKICVERKMAIISDEVFWEFGLAEPSHQSLINNKPCLTFVLSGLSKMFGLPQMKLSWIIVSGPAKTVSSAKERLEVIADTYLSVNTPTQNAVKLWGKEKTDIQKEIQNRIKDNFKFIKSQMKTV